MYFLHFSGRSIKVRLPTQQDEDTYIARDFSLASKKQKKTLYYNKK